MILCIWRKADEHLQEVNFFEYAATGGSQSVTEPGNFFAFCQMDLLISHLIHSYLLFPYLKPYIYHTA